MVIIFFILRIKSKCIVDPGFLSNDDAAHATAVDAQHSDNAPVGRWRRPGCAQRRRAVAKRKLRRVQNI
jgi:hypothetical protein